MTSTFEAFLGRDLDRPAFISAWLRAREIRHSLVELAGRRHIVVTFAPEAYDPRFRMKTLIAHHDRAPGTQGANDNSAACFLLMQFSERLSRSPASHNVRVIFTDGEEAAGARGITGQGAFALGSGLRKLGADADDTYVFDACGRGDTLVLSTSGFPAGSGPDRAEGRRGRLYGLMEDLHRRAAETARAVSPEAWIRLATPYSDNAGFLAAGIPAQVITVLPHTEASALLGYIGKPGSDTDRLARVITGNKPLGQDDPLGPVIPETWKLLHTERDNAASLTASAFTLIESFLSALAARMDIAP